MKALKVAAILAVACVGAVYACICLAGFDYYRRQMQEPS